MALAETIDRILPDWLKPPSPLTIVVGKINEAGPHPLKRQKEVLSYLATEMDHRTWRGLREIILESDNPIDQATLLGETYLHAIGFGRGKKDGLNLPAIIEDAFQQHLRTDSDNAYMFYDLLNSYNPATKVLVDTSGVHILFPIEEFKPEPVSIITEHELESRTDDEALRQHFLSTAHTTDTNPSHSDS